MLPKFIVTISVLACLATRAFAGCAIGPDGNGNVVIPNTWTSIGDYAFSECSSLTTVTFEEGGQLTSIGAWAFSESGLTSIEIPSTVTSIVGLAFYKCDSLTTVTFEEGGQLTSIGTYAFFRTALLSLIHI